AITELFQFVVQIPHSLLLLVSFVVGVCCALISVVVRLEDLSPSSTTRDTGHHSRLVQGFCSLPALHGAFWFGIDGHAGGHGHTSQALTQTWRGVIATR